MAVKANDSNMHTIPTREQHMNLSETYPMAKGSPFGDSLEVFKLKKGKGNKKYILLHITILQYDSCVVFQEHCKKPKILPADMCL